MKRQDRRARNSMTSVDPTGCGPGRRRRPTRSASPSMRRCRLGARGSDARDSDRRGFGTVGSGGGGWGSCRLGCSTAPRYRGRAFRGWGGFAAPPVPLPPVDDDFLKRRGPSLMCVDDCSRVSRRMSCALAAAGARRRAIGARLDAREQLLDIRAGDRDLPWTTLKAVCIAGELWIARDHDAPSALQVETEK